MALKNLTLANVTARYLLKLGFQDVCVVQDVEEAFRIVQSFVEKQNALPTTECPPPPPTTWLFFFLDNMLITEPSHSALLRSLSQSPRVALAFLGFVNPAPAPLHPLWIFLQRPLKLSCLRQKIKQMLLCAAFQDSDRAPLESKDRTNRDPSFSQLHPLRILVAEDNTIIKAVMTQMMKGLGYEDAEFASNGIEVIEMVKSAINQSKPFDLILMDLMMPYVDGIEASARIRRELGPPAEGTARSIWVSDIPNQLSPLTHRPVIVALSAHSVNDQRTLCAQSGIQMFLQKPITRSGLERVISAVYSCLQKL